MPLDSQTGALAGLGGDAAAQATSMALGTQQNFDPGQLAAAGALGGALGAGANALGKALKAKCPPKIADPSKALADLKAEQAALQKALQEDQQALQNAKDLAQLIRYSGGEPNPYGLLQDLADFQWQVNAKQSRLNQIAAQIAALQKGQ